MCGIDLGAGEAEAGGVVVCGTCLEGVGGWSVGRTGVEAGEDDSGAGPGVGHSGDDEVGVLVWLLSV